MRNLGKWTIKGFRIRTGRREIVWRGWKPMKPFNIGSTRVHKVGPFALFTMNKQEKN